jgi:hypothetical protein
MHQVKCETCGRFPSETVTVTTSADAERIAELEEKDARWRRLVQDVAVTIFTFATEQDDVTWSILEMHMARYMQYKIGEVPNPFAEFKDRINRLERVVEAATNLRETCISLFYGADGQTTFYGSAGDHSCLDDAVRKMYDALNAADDGGKEGEA